MPFPEKRSISLLVEWLVKNPEIENLYSDLDQFPRPGFCNIPVDSNDYNKLYKLYAQSLSLLNDDVMQHPQYRCERWWDSEKVRIAGLAWLFLLVPSETPGCRGMRGAPVRDARGKLGLWPYSPPEFGVYQAPAKRRTDRCFCVGAGWTPPPRHPHSVDLG